MIQIMQERINKTRANAQQQRHQANSQTRENSSSKKEQQIHSNNSPLQENKIKTKAQLDNEIEKLRMKLKSVKRNSIEEVQLAINQNKQIQQKENDIPKNIILNQKNEQKINLKQNSGQKSAKSSVNTSCIQNNINSVNNKKVFSDEVSDRILNDLKKSTAQKVEDFIENCYKGTQKPQNNIIHQQQHSILQQGIQNKESKDSKYLKIADLSSVISNQNKLDNSTSNSSVLQKGTNQVPHIKQSLNINTGNIYGSNINQNNNIGSESLNEAGNICYSAYTGIPTKSSVNRHSQGSLSVNNVFACGLNSNSVTPQNGQNIQMAGLHANGEQCELRKCTNCMKRREKSAEKVDRRKLSENKKQFLNKYNISDTRKEYSSYKEQKVQQRRFSIHTNQIQEPFNFALQANSDLNVSSNNVKNQSWIQQNNTLNYQLLPQYQQQQNPQQSQYQQSNLYQQDLSQVESFLDNSWQNKVSSHVKALQQALADNGGNGNSSNNSRFMILNDLNYSQIDHPKNKNMKDDNNQNYGIGDFSGNYKSLNTTNIADNSVILNNQSYMQQQQQMNQINHNTHFKPLNTKQPQQNNADQSIRLQDSDQNYSQIRVNVENTDNSLYAQGTLNSGSVCIGGLQNGTSKFAVLENDQTQDSIQNTQEKIQRQLLGSDQEFQFQKQTFSKVVEHYEQLLKEKEMQNENIIDKYELMLKEMHIENEELQEYKEQLIIMNNDLAKELEQEQKKNIELVDDESSMKNKFQFQETKLKTEISSFQTKIQLLEKEKSQLNKAFEYKSIECDVLKDEQLKVKQTLSDYQNQIEQQKHLVEEYKQQKQQDHELFNSKQTEIHSSYKYQFNQFSEKIQQMKVINDDYLIANKKEFESIEKRLYEDSQAIKPSNTSSTQREDIQRNLKLEQENRLLIEKLKQKEEELCVYKESSMKQDKLNMSIIENEQKKIKTQFDNEIVNYNNSIQMLKTNEEKLVQIISQLEETISIKDKEILNLKQAILVVDQSKADMEKATKQLQQKISIIEEQETILEKKMHDLSVSNQTSVEANQNTFESSRGSEIQLLLQKIHKLQLQNKQLNEEIIEKEKDVNILQYQNQLCQKELEELRCGIQEFEIEVQEMKRIYNLSFENEKKSIIQFYEQKVEQQSKQIMSLNEQIARNKSDSFNNTYSQETQQDEYHQKLFTAYSDPNFISSNKRIIPNPVQTRLPPTNSKKTINSSSNLQKQDSNLTLNRKHNETFEETFEDGRGGSFSKLPNIVVNPITQNQHKDQEKQKCTFIEYMNKFTNEKGELNTDAFEKEIFQLKEKELLDEIDNLNKKYYLQEQNTQLELSWIKKQNESTAYLDNTTYKEQLDSLQNQIDSLKMIKQQLSAVSKEIEQRFEGNISEEFIEELKQKQIQIQINEKEIIQKLEQYTSINEELQLEYSKNINISEIIEFGENSQRKSQKEKLNHISPYKLSSQSNYKKLDEIESASQFHASEQNNGEE